MYKSKYLLKKVAVIALILSSLFFFTSSVYAQQREEVGVGVEDYSKEGMFADKNLIVEKAIKKACKNAFDQYVKSFDEIQRENYERLKATIEKDLENLVNCQNIVDEVDDKDKKRYSVKVKAKIDASGVKVLLSKGSTIRQTAKGERPIIVHHFYSRYIDTATKKDDRLTKVGTETKSKDINQSEAIKEGDIAISSETTKTNKNVSGGNVVRTTTRYTYKVSDGDTLPAETGLTSVMAGAGYRLQAANRTKGLEALSRKVMSEYSTKETLSAETTNQILDVLANGKGKYYLTGVFDIGEEEIDKSTGNVVVNVVLTSAVLEDIQEKTNEGSASGISVKGEGTTYAQAKINAITAAAKKAGEQIIASINQQSQN